jgi:hypothetical protein
MLGFILESTISDDVADEWVDSVIASHIFLDTVTLVTISGFKSDNNRGISVLAMQYIGYLEMTDSVFDWTEGLANSAANLLALENANPQLSQLNNLFPPTLECLQSKTYNRAFNNIQIYVSKFAIGVYFENVIVRNLLTIDRPLIKVESYDILIYNTSMPHTEYG